MAVTRTLGTELPEGSVTVPVKAPVPAVCPSALDATHNAKHTDLHFDAISSPPQLRRTGRAKPPASAASVTCCRVWTNECQSARAEPLPVTVNGCSAKT